MARKKNEVPIKVKFLRLATIPHFHTPICNKKKKKKKKKIEQEV